MRSLRSSLNIVSLGEEISLSIFASSCFQDEYLLLMGDLSCLISPAELNLEMGKLSARDILGLKSADNAAEEASERILQRSG